MTLLWSLPGWKFSESNICSSAGDVASNPNHESESYRVEGGLYRNCNRRGRVGAGLACGQADTNIMLADVFPRVYVLASFLRKIIQLLLECTR